MASVPLLRVTALVGRSQDTHNAPPLLSEAELFCRRNAFALLNAAGWVCSKVAFKGWKRDTGPGCEAQGQVIRDKAVYGEDGLQYIF